MKQKNLRNNSLFHGGRRWRCSSSCSPFTSSAAPFKQRVDLTAEKAFTLSPGTKADPGQTGFAGDHSLLLHAGRHGHAPCCAKPTPSTSRICWANTSRPAKGKIVIEKYDPKPDSDAEDSARLERRGGAADLAPLAAIKFTSAWWSACWTRKVAIPWLAPDRERLLEYDISRAIARVDQSDAAAAGRDERAAHFRRGPINPMMMQQQSAPARTVGLPQRNEKGFHPSRGADDRHQD